ncbi:MAG: ABC transporter permease [Coriobacteriia bacterium]|nr:ABC transporter permease [Coriobacteriia bacterium]MCL2870699.1 ABC transporter permease [Coriobacteriia bacterium]
MNLSGLQLFTDAFIDGFEMLAVGTVDLWHIILTSLQVSGLATGIAVFIGIPAGYWLGSRRNVRRFTALVIANAGMGLPPIVAGLFVSMLLSRSGVFGGLGLLYTRPAIVIVQVVIATPVVVALTASGISAVPTQLRLQARSLGASRFQEVALAVREARLSILGAVAGGFGAVISEVGAVQMVGGNLAGQTQVMTTAIMQFTRMGRFGVAMALSVILLAIIVVVNIIITYEQVRDERYTKALS